MRKKLTKIFWNIEVWAVQKHVNLVYFFKSFPTHILLQIWLRYSRWRALSNFPALRVQIPQVRRISGWVSRRVCRDACEEGTLLVFWRTMRRKSQWWAEPELVILPRGWAILSLMLQHCAEEEYHTLLDLSGNVSYTSWAQQMLRIHS